MPKGPNEKQNLASFICWFTLFNVGWAECNGTHRLWKCGGFRYTLPTLQNFVAEQIEKVLTTLAVL